jgi:AraC family transcriptional regulator
MRSSDFLRFPNLRSSHYSASLNSNLFNCRSLDLEGPFNSPLDGFLINCSRISKPELTKMMPHQSSPIVLGERDRCVKLAGFVLTETVRPAKLTLPRHFHEHTNIAFVIKGSFIETIGERPHECGPYSLIIRPAGEPHFNQYSSTEAHCLIIEVKPERLVTIQQESNILDSACHLREEALSVLALRLYKEFQTMDSASLLSIESLILEILAHAIRQSAVRSPSTQPRWLLEARGMIHEQFSEQVSLSAIAQSVGVHPAHLAKMFRRHYQCTMGDYVRRLRLDYAARELIESDKSLPEIALAAGFYDQSHFTRAFRLHLKTTPAEFRAAIKTRKADTKKLGLSKTL